MTYAVGNPKSRYGFKRCLAVVKEAVPVMVVADLLCGPGSFRRVNTHWLGCCPLPDHEDKTPSFVVYSSSNSWWCFGCSRVRTF
jgi:DNA primase